MSAAAVAAAFANPELRRLQLAWAGMAFSLWSFTIALGVYAFDVGGPTAVGIAALVRLVPGALASPFAGLLGDRYPRSLVLLGSALAGGLTLLAAAGLAAGGAPPGVVFALAGLFMAASSPYVPAEGALLPAVASTPQELSAANVAHSAMDNGGFLLGSLLTGALLTVSSPALVFAVAGAAAVITVALLAGLRRDERPAYQPEARAVGVLRQAALGLRALVGDPGLRLPGAALTILVFFEGAADVLIVIVALDLLELGEGSVGYMNAAWGVGALVGGAILALLLQRGRLATGLVVGSIVIGVATTLPGAWPVAAAAYATWLGVGIGYTFVEVAARTLMQRLGSDEVLARVFGVLETARLAAMAVGSIAAPAVVALVGARGALLVLAAVMPLFALLRWASLRAFETGAPVAERPYALLRADPIFEPLPVATVERLSLDAVAVEARAGEEIIVQGEAGDRFYLIDAGQVEVFENGALKRTEGEGESFGEIALLRDVPRTATVRASRPTRLLSLDRDHFIAAVAGHARSHQAARRTAEARLPAEVREDAAAE